MLEDGILVTLLSVMLSTAVLQIFLRNLFESGLSWADPMLRILVLWVGMVGAILASRENNHISMNILTHFLPAKVKRAVKVLVDIFTSLVSAIIAYHSFKFVLSEYQVGTIAFASVPSWLCESIIPAAFTIIALRYLIFALWHSRMVVPAREVP